MAAGTAERPDTIDSRATWARGLGQLLDEIESLLLVVPVAVYQTPSEEHAGTIGQHVDRCLDLIDTLLSVGSSGIIVYQHHAYHHHDRGTASATNSADALRRVRALKKPLDGWPKRPLDGVISVDHVVWPFGEFERGWSTLAGEIAFVANHIVHAQTLIAQLMSGFRLSVPDGFGSMPLAALRARSSVRPSW